MKLGIYRHFKGSEYEVIGISKHSETMEELVVYKALYDEGGLWVRPLSMWDETVVEQHLTGRATIGVYPMFVNETCRFIVMDFDSHDVGINNYESDIKAIVIYQ